MSLSQEVDCQRNEGTQLSQQGLHLSQEDPFLMQQSKQLRFDVIVRFLNRFSQLRGPKKCAYLKDFIRVLCKFNRSAEFLHGVVRLLLPGEDRARGNYGLKEKSIAKVAAESLALKREDYDRLLHYKNPSFQREGVTVGDFSLCLFDIVKPYARSTSQLTVEELNELLTQLAGSKEQVTVFRRLFTRGTAEELKWVTRIVLKDLKVLLKVEDVLIAYHCDAYDFYNLTNNLSDTFRKFQNPCTSLRDEVQLFSPVSPMLAARKKLQYFEESRRLFVQTKFDGERVQAHKSGDKVQLFSRNAVDYTETYSEVAAAVRLVRAESCVLDGEVIVVEKDSLQMVAFGLNKVVALKNCEGYQLCYMVFDVLWVSEEGEGVNLLPLPLEERKGLLNSIVQNHPGRIQVVAHEVLHDYEAVLRRFGESIDRNEEGIMLKDPAARYQPKERGWLKLKGDYVDGLTDTLDLVVLGAYFGDSSARHGHGSHWTDRLTSFLLGVIEQVDPLNARSAFALPFAKVGTGYDLDQLARLRARLKPALVVNEASFRPPYLRQAWKHSLQDRPDCYVHCLNQSVVFEVKAAEIILSDSYPVGYTLRFPRFLRLREDKSWNQGLSSQSLMQMLDEELYCKNMKRKREEESDEEAPHKPTKKIKQENRRPDILDQFRSFNIKDQRLVSHLFHGLQFAILPMECKLAVERDIVLHGGTVVQNPLMSTQFIVCEDIDFRLKAYAGEERRNYSFIRPLYIRKSIAAEKVLPLTPIYLTALPERELVYYRENFDRFGDSYTGQLAQGELEDILDTMHEDYYLNAQLSLDLHFPLQGKRAFSLGLTRLDKVKLKLRGCIFIQYSHQIAFDGSQPNAVVVGQKPFDTALLTSFIHRGLEIIYSSEHIS